MELSAAILSAYAIVFIGLRQKKASLKTGWQHKINLVDV
jgi:hypothetical protein